MSFEPRPLPAPGVVFSEDFLPRVEALYLRLSSARELREGAGSAAVVGQGEEFAGHRPYRPGEDLRQLDWSLLARLDKPFVRVTRREAGESWAVLLDASASMGLGTPGKLQRAAECALALTSIGLRFGACVQLFISGAGAGAVRRLSLRSREESSIALELLAGVQATGGVGLGELVSAPRAFADCGRVFLLGDLFDLEPHQVQPLRRAGRALCILQLLASEELQPILGSQSFWDPEGPGELELEVDSGLLAAYESRLDAKLEGWRRLAGVAGVLYTRPASTTAFKDLVRELVGA